MKTQTTKLQLHSQPCEVAYRYRQGPKEAIVVLHGYGSIKEDYEPLFGREALKGHATLVYDAPGHGRSTASAPEKLSVEDNLAAARGLIKELGIKRAHLVYHSMGGIPAMMLAAEKPSLIASLTNIEGNLAPEDCMYSRKILEYAPADDDKFFEAFTADLQASASPREPEYGTALSERVGPWATGAYFRSIVKHTLEDGMLEQFLELSVPRHFIYGQENRHLSYIPTLKENGVLVTEIPNAGHLPMYANPDALWQAIEEFIRQIV